MRIAVAALGVAACGFRGNAGEGVAIDAASSSIDAPRPDGPPLDSANGERLVVEAEAHDALTMPSTQMWTLQTTADEFSGAGYMRCGPDRGSSCQDPGALGACAAAMVFDLQVVTGGLHSLHVRALALDTSDNSVWFTVGNGSPVQLNLNATGAWEWNLGAGTYDLSPGTHRLVIYQRESGAAVDVVGMTTSMAPPF